DDVVAEFLQVTRRSIRPVFIEVWRLDVAADRLREHLSADDDDAPRRTVSIDVAAPAAGVSDDIPHLVPLLSKRPAIDVDVALLAFLDKSEPQICDDETPAPFAVRDPAGDTSVIVRLAVAGEIVGLLVVGERSDGLPYEGTDVAFIGALAGPLAAALVSTLAFEAVERMNRDLELRVQARTAELAQKNDELALLNQRKDDLVNSVSHDFRSPLAIIRQNVQTVLRDLPHIDDDDLKMFLEAIARQESRLTSMCTNLLDLARLKQTAPPKEAVDLRVLCRMIVEVFAGKAAAKGVALVLEIEAGADIEGALVVAGDGDRLGQVVQNLVDNALKFTSSGSITIGLSQVAAGDRDDVVLVVADTGVGVPAEALPRLFEPFFQVPSQAHVGQGSGLGLAIVKTVIEAHHGSIDVDAVEGRGTVFTVRLPRSC
ncbi:MAG TPA: HAMP domain-containing sensor histidine kinase, partial [Myxococcota bacterium]